MEQARWQDFLAEYDFDHGHKLGHANVVGDALSWRAELAALKVQEVEHVNRCRGNLVNQIKEVKGDSFVQTMLAQVRNGKIWKFWEQDGSPYVRGNQVYV